MLNYTKNALEGTRVFSKQAFALGTMRPWRLSAWLIEKRTPALSPTLLLKKSLLRTKDAKEKWEKSPSFAVGFSADEAGPQTIDVKATFFVCDVKICERKSEKISVPVSVRQ